MLIDHAFEAAQAETDDEPAVGFRVVGNLLLGLLAIAGLAYLTLFWFAGDRVPHGAQVDGIMIGGLRPAAAQAKLERELGQRAAQPITLTYAGKSVSVNPSTAGLSVDYAASVAAAGGTHSLDPVRLWSFYTGGEHVAPVVTVDPGRLQAAVDALAGRFDHPAREGAIRFTSGQVAPVAALPGRSLDRAATRALLRRQFLHVGHRELLVRQVAPYVDDAAVAKAMNDFANPAMAGPVLLEVGGLRVLIPPKAYSATLSMVATGHALVPKVDGNRLVTELHALMPGIGERAVDARVRIVNGHPQVFPARVGVRFDAAELARDFATYAGRPPGQRVMPVPARVSQPGLTTAAARALNITAPVASASFTLPGVAPAALPSSTRLVDNVLLRPNQTVSFAGLRGSDAGASVATATYSAVLRAGLDVPSRTHHPSYDPRFPAGRDAVALSARNPGPDGVLLTAQVNGATVSVTAWSTRGAVVGLTTGQRYAVTRLPARLDSSPSCRPVVGRPGFSIDLFRTVRPLGQATGTTARLSTTYAPTAAVRCSG
ncbi:MAG: peptidoglycan binding domain-containing protein [Actinomycetota bacterium]|nr:peptidoglycan binding domain-containing protein [Actinomycetota bacterium]